MSRRRRGRKSEVEWQDGRRSSEHTHVGRVTVFQRGRTWYLRYREGGVERRVRIGADKKVAEQHAAEVNAQLVCGIRSTFQFEKIRIDDLVRRWLEHHELVKRSSMRTVDRYRTAIAHLARYARERRPGLAIDTLTVPVAEEFVKFLRTVKISPNGCDRTKKRHMRDRGVLSVLRTCRALWNFAFQHRHVPPYSTNPFTDIKIESMRIDDMKPKYILAEAEEADFLEACPPWEFRVFFTLAFTGMRPGELIHLLVDDVSFDTRTVLIRNHHELGWRTKTRGERRAFLFDELLGVFREAVGLRTCGPVFLAPKYTAGKAVPPLAGLDTPSLGMELAKRIEVAASENPDTSRRRIETAEVRKLWRDAGAIRQNVIRSRFIKIAKRIGKPHLTSPYSFRHGMATAMQAADVDPFVRKEIIGHTSLETTAIYTHTADLTIARGMKQAAELRPQSLGVARSRLACPATGDGRAPRRAATGRR